LEKHYSDLSSRPFFPGLVSYMASGPVVPMVWEGLNAVKTGRVMLGATNPADSAPGTIRGDLCVQVGRNIIHGSDSVESANKEIALWFKVTFKLKSFMSKRIMILIRNYLIAGLRTCLMDTSKC
jgi:nucleoside-diphosphate kinase